MGNRGVLLYVDLGKLEDEPYRLLHIPQELRIRSRGTERHSASN